MQYMLMGAGTIKRRVTLTAENIFERAEMYWRHVLGACGRYGFAIVLREMMRSGKFYPSARWIIPTQGRGMSMARAQVMFRMVHSYERTSISDIKLLFFDTTNVLGY